MSYKITVVNGSPRGVKSSTRKLIDNILNNLSAEVDIEINHYDFSKIKVLNCRGCLNCFELGKCPQDRKDKLIDLKKDILIADLFIIGTPIYAGNVTAQLKCILDRLSYWMHLMCLCGKPTLIVTSSCGNGVYFTKTYLSSMVSFLGGFLISCENFTIYSEQDLQSSDIMTQCLEASKKIEKIIDSKEIDKSSKSYMDVNTIFQAMQTNMKLYEDEPNFEYEFWLKNGMMYAKNYDEIIEKHNTIIINLMEDL